MNSTVSAPASPKPAYTADRWRAGGLLGLAERGWLPDAAIRHGIRRLCAQRLREERAGNLGAQHDLYRSRIEMLRRSPIAIHTDAANGQHYELPPEFFARCLGPQMKYSCCYYPTGEETLAQAETAMLELYGQRAQLEDGQCILELGCGWGSMTLWMARRYPAAQIVAVSNSRPQREHIERRCRELGLSNVLAMTADVNCLALDPMRFDRCISIEMFEHMRNYEHLLRRISNWLQPDGKLFAHIFCHRDLMYPFDTQAEDDWMGRHFFTGGLMPSAETLLWFQNHLRIDKRWLLDGSHYQRTANHWLANQDACRGETDRALELAYGDAYRLWRQRWRMFWMACAELFGYDDGQQWGVAHYLFSKR